MPEKENQKTKENDNQTGIKAKFYMDGSKRFYPCFCGQYHVSVTTFLDVIGSPALIGWSAKHGTKKLNILAKHVKKNIPPNMFEAISQQCEIEWEKQGEKYFWKSGWEQSKDAADYGTTAHAAFEMYLKGKSVDIKSLPEPSRNSYEVFVKYAKENDLETIDTERTFYNCQLDYAGTADWRGRVNGKLTMADFKTSNGIFEKFIIQAWANAISDEMQFGNRLYEQIIIMRFGKDGTTDILTCSRNGKIDLNGKTVQSSGYFCSYEQARKLIESCLPWFQYKQEWERVFPYRKKK